MNSITYIKMKTELIIIIFMFACVSPVYAKYKISRDDIIHDTVIKNESINKSCDTHKNDSTVQIKDNNVKIGTISNSGGIKKNVHQSVSKKNFTINTIGNN